MSAINFDININSQPALQNVNTALQTSSEERIPQSNENAAKEEIREDLIAVSDDGDTLQASKMAISASENGGILVAASEDGAVTQREISDNPEDMLSLSKPFEVADDGKSAAELRLEQANAMQEVQSVLETEENPEEENEAATTNNNSDEEVNSLAGYTKSQVEQLYLQGRISRYNYDRNMEERAERMGNSDDSAATEIREDQKASNEAFSEQMGRLVATSENIQNSNEAYINAIANGREDIAENLFK